MGMFQLEKWCFASKKQFFPGGNGTKSYGNSVFAYAIIIFTYGNRTFPYVNGVFPYGNGAVAYAKLFSRTQKSFLRTRRRHFHMAMKHCRHELNWKEIMKTRSFKINSKKILPVHVQVGCKKEVNSIHFRNALEILKNES